MKSRCGGGECGSCHRLGGREEGLLIDGCERGAGKGGAVIGVVAKRVVVVVGVVAIVAVEDAVE